MRRRSGRSRTLSRADASTTKSRAIFAGRSRWRFAARNSAAERPFYRRWSVSACWRHWSDCRRLALPEIFCYYSPHVALLKPDQIEFTGNHVVSRDAVLQQFVRDRGQQRRQHPARRAPQRARSTSVGRTANVAAHSAEPHPRRVHRAHAGRVSSHWHRAWPCGRPRRHPRSSVEAKISIFRSSPASATA